MLLRTYHLGEGGGVLQAKNIFWTAWDIIPRCIQKNLNSFRFGAVIMLNKVSKAWRILWLTIDLMLIIAWTCAFVIKFAGNVEMSYHGKITLEFIYVPIPWSRDLKHGTLNSFFGMRRWFDLRWDRCQSRIITNLGCYRFLVISNV